MSLCDINVCVFNSIQFLKRVIILKSPLWIDHLLCHIVQVIPRREQRGIR